MPTISMFYGIAIQMFWDEHAPPHFHATYGGSEVAINIKNLTVMNGKLPNRALKLVLEWAQNHQTELMEDWNLCEKQLPPRKIRPLR